MCLLFFFPLDAHALLVALLAQVKEEMTIFNKERNSFFSHGIGQDPGGMQLSLLIVVGFFQAHVYSHSASHFSQIPRQRDTVTCKGTHVRLCVRVCVSALIM